MTDLNSFSSNSCEAETNIKDINNLTKMETECGIPEDLSQTIFQKMNETVNEEDSSLKNSSLNEQNISTDDHYDDKTLGYSQEVVHEVYNDDDTLTITWDESLKSSPNDMVEIVTESVTNILNNKDESGQYWSNVQESFREEGEISDEYDMKDENQSDKNWKTMQHEISLHKHIKPMQFVFGLLCMAFKKGGPYEYTLANMSHYISGECDENRNWLKNLDFYIKKLNITHLYVIGQNQASFINKHVDSAKVQVLHKHLLPKRETKCPKCFRFGCSKYKVSSILHYNFVYDFKIPCVFKNIF